ncbi:MAG: hypothetical protein MUF85_02640 [Patescibacteria group bacterium]|jgi:hypothetical protein|nr:hypothetical protein [Patescibacteria group bacterium]
MTIKSPKEERQKIYNLHNRVAEGITSLIRIKILEAISKEDLDSLVPYIKQTMTEVLLATNPGTYCHDGGNLLEDTLEKLGLTNADLTNDLFFELDWLAMLVSADLEGDCDFCNDTNDEE